MVKITFEFPTIDAAIVAMGKLVAPAKSAARQDTTGDRATEQTNPTAAPVAAAQPKKARKPRADAGKTRGPHGAQPTAPQAPAVTPAAAPAPAPDPQVQQEQKPAAAAPIPKPEDAQAALEGLFNAKGIAVAQEVMGRFGIKRLKELQEGQRAEFISACEAVLKGEAA